MLSQGTWMMTYLLKSPVKKFETLHMLVHWSLAGWAALLINAWHIINCHTNCLGTSFSFHWLWMDLYAKHFTHIFLDKGFRTQSLKYLFAYYQTCFHKGRIVYVTMEVNFFHSSLSYRKVFRSEWGKFYGKELLLLFLSHFKWLYSLLQQFGCFTSTKHRVLLITSHTWIEKDEEKETRNLLLTEVNLHQMALAKSHDQAIILFTVNKNTFESFSHPCSREICNFHWYINKLWFICSICVKEVIFGGIWIIVLGFLM